MVATKPKSSPSSGVSASAEVPIKCIGLTKIFKDFWMRNRVTAVNNIDLEVRRGEVFGLLGPNGSGKSTTIKMILGLLNPTAGKIAVLGRAPSDVAIKSKIGYLPEESYLYRFLTPGETLDYYGKLFGQDGAQRKKRTETLLEMVGLTHAARRPVGEFSKGMQRKVGLAQALINDPDLLILDEPTSGMDPIATAEVKEVILELKRRGKTVLLCSHILGDVQDLCDRVVVMYGGKIREEGRLEDLLKVEDKTIIETDHIDDDLVTEIEKVLERHGRSVLKSEHPRKDLDQLFMEIVEKARTEGARTAGATQGGKIADFLSDTTEGSGAAASDSQSVLNALSHSADETVQSEVAVGDSPAQTGDEAAGSSQTGPSVQHDVLSGGTGDETVLEQLASASASTETDAPVPSASEAEHKASTPPSTQSNDDEQANDAADRSVLDSLLGGEGNKPS